VLREPHSFSKPTFYLGLANWTVTNVVGAGAHDRTPGRVRLLLMGAAGFERTGDYMCFKLQVRCVRLQRDAAAGVRRKAVLLQ
jgi:hypothetical protein